MSSPTRCQTCGDEISASSPEGLCPTCLGKLALEGPPAASSAPALPGLGLEDKPPKAGGEQPGDRIGNYRLLQKIGEGGFGVVYMAEQEQPVRRRVALKVIKLGMDTRQVVARFEAERQALALMDHPNIAHVLDAGATDTGRPYFVMELVKGVRITQYCNQHRLALNARLELFLQICHAIQHAHQKGIIHRDIKPSNIMVTMHDPAAAGCPKVIDFGIAKATEMRLTDKTLFTQYEQFMGTPAYMSPEQAEMTGLDIDTRSDIYSLGVLLYELLTGRPPFSNQALLEKGIEEARRTIRETEPPRPSTRLSTLADGDLSLVANERSAEGPKLLSLVRGDLDWIVMKCLEKDRTRRYETANGLAMDVKRFLDQEPIVARPPSKVYLLQKLVRRHQAAFGAAVVVLATLLIGLGVSTWSFLRERAARTQLETARVSEAAALRLAEQKAEAEALERARAEENDAQARATVTRLEINQAEMLFATDHSTEALAYLARALRREPTNRMVGERILSALAHRNFCVPLFRLELKGTATSAEFSPDGQSVLTVSKAGPAQVWDARTGQPLLGPFRHGDEVTAAHFSPDGARLVTASLDQTARIWDARTGRPITESLPHAGGVMCADFSPDGQRLATGSMDGSMRLWNTETGMLLGTPVTVGGRVDFVKFSPDDKSILVASQQVGRGRLVNAVDGTELAAFWMPAGELSPELNLASPSFSADGARFVAPWSGTILNVIGTAAPSTIRDTPKLHQNTITCARFSPDGQTLATSGFDSAARIWDVATFQQVAEIVHGNWVNSIEFSPDGRQVVTGAKDHTARIWNALTGQPLSEPMRHDASVLSVEFSPDGQRILSRCKGPSVWVWAVRRGQPMTASLPHSQPVRKAVFSPDGGQVATTDIYQNLGRAHLWDARRATRLLPPLGPGAGDVQFSRDGRRLLALDLDNGGTLTVWDTRTGAVLGRPIYDNIRTNQTSCARFSPDGNQLVLAGASGSSYRVRVWDIAAGTVVREFPHQDGAGFAQFSPDGRWVVTASADKTARLWDLTTGQLLTQPLPHDGAVLWADVSADSRRVVTLSLDKAARIWEVPSGRLLHTLRHAQEPYHYNSVEFSPDGRMVATAAGNAAQVWSAQTGQAVTAPLKHDGRVNSVRFGPHGRRVVTACHDGSARVWDAASGHLVNDLLRHRDRVNYAEFSADGRWVITASNDGTARIWEVPIFTSSVPSWLADWAEAIAGRRIDVQNASQSVPSDEVIRLRQRLERATDSDEAARWARWFWAENAARTISPSSAIPVSQWAMQRMADGTLESLQEAAWLFPTNALAQARLAFATLTNELKPSPRQMASADWQSLRAVALAPEDPDVLCARAEFCERLGRVSEALDLMERASRLNPTQPAFWKVKARMLEQTNRLEEAYQAYSQALSMPISNGEFLAGRSEVYLRRSELLRRLNRPTESDADYERYVETDIPAGVCNHLAWELATGPAENRDPARAVILAQKAVRLIPRDANVVNTLGVAQYRAGRHRQAVATLQEAGKLNPDGPTAYDLFFQAMSYQQLGETGQARACLENAMRWCRDHPTLPQGLSIAELKSFQAEAEALLNQEKRP